MTFREGILHARSHLVFMLGLAAAFAGIAYLEGWDMSGIVDPGGARAGRTSVALPEAFEHIEARTVGEAAFQSDEFEGWAETAWTYFENNTQPDTGLVNSVDGYPSTTLWDTGSYFLGLISAHRLGVVRDDEFEARVGDILEALKNMPLVDDRLPNKAYDTRSLQMVDYDNSEAREGIGWSAIDIARMMVPLQVLVWNHPEFTHRVREAIGGWRFDQMFRDGMMYGAARDDSGELELLQEGRLGYEEYAAKSFSLLGFDIRSAILYDDHLDVVDVEGIPVATDSRDYATFGAHNYVVSEPYVLDGIEFGFDEASRELAANVFVAQRNRARRSGVLTAVSETHLGRAPYFIYNTVFANGTRWNAITEANEDASEFRTFSTKAALGWYVLFSDPYSDELLDGLAGLMEKGKGFYSGRYERNGEINRAITANTNALILECLAYLKHGALLALDQPEEQTLGSDALAAAH